MFLIMGLGTVSLGCIRYCNNYRNISYRSIALAGNNANKWINEIRQKSRSLHKHVPDKKSIHVASKSIKDIAPNIIKVSVDKVRVTPIATLNFQKMRVDTVSSRLSAAVNSTKESIVHNIGAPEVVEVEFQKPIKKTIHCDKQDMIGLVHKGENEKAEEKQGPGILEITSSDIVEVSKVKVESSNMFKIATLLDTVKLEGNVVLAEYLEDQATKEAKQVVQKTQVDEDLVQTKLAASIRLDDIDNVASAGLKEKVIATDNVANVAVTSSPIDGAVTQKVDIDSEVNNIQNSISTTVKQVIEREMSKPVVHRAIYASKMNTQKAAPGHSDDGRLFEYSPCDSNRSKSFSRIDLFAYSGGSLGSQAPKISNYEFVPQYGQYDDEDRKGDTSGIITFCKDLNDRSSLMAGAIKRDGYVASSILLGFAEVYQQVNVPLIEREVFDKMVAEYSLDSRMSAILIGIEKFDEKVKIKIDSENSIKIKLNADLVVIEEESEIAEYILFLNVEPRNIHVTYYFDKDDPTDFVEKIVFAPSGMVFFDNPSMTKSLEANPLPEILDLSQRNIAGIESSELNIEGNELKRFNRKIRGQKIGLSRIKLNKPKSLDKMRNYIALEHLEKTVYVGYGMNKSLEVPSDEFINYSLDKMGVDRELEQQCVIQINLRENMILQDVVMDAQNANGPLYFKQFYFDSNGIFYEGEWSEKTTKILIASELTQLNKGSVATGTVGVKLKYTNGTTDYIQSFCSNETYLVEQL